MYFIEVSTSGVDIDGIIECHGRRDGSQSREINGKVATLK